jgi:hypothetical protein
LASLLTSQKGFISTSSSLASVSGSSQVEDNMKVCDFRVRHNSLSLGHFLLDAGATFVPTEEEGEGLDDMPAWA